MARTGGSRYDILLLCVKDGRSVQGSKADMRKVGPSKIRRERVYGVDQRYRDTRAGLS